MKRGVKSKTEQNEKKELNSKKKTNRCTMKRCEQTEGTHLHPKQNKLTKNSFSEIL